MLRTVSGQFARSKNSTFWGSRSVEVESFPGGVNLTLPEAAEYGAMSNATAAALGVALCEVAGVPAATKELTGTAMPAQVPALDLDGSYITEDGDDLVLFSREGVVLKVFVVPTGRWVAESA